MKEVVTGEELKKIMQEAINILCDSVSSTLGPSGNNVLINTSDTSPYITNDGYTIANALEVEDKKINTVIEIAKEASLKTNEEVGDGTTTTLVLLQSIFNEGLKEIENGKNPIILKKELTEAMEEVIKELDKLKRLPSKEELLNVAINSSEDKEIGKLLTEIYLKMHSRYACRLIESSSQEEYYEIKKGYSLEIDNIPSIYFDNIDTISLKNTYILLVKGYLTDLEIISDMINEGLNRNKNIIILAEDYDIEIEREVLLYYLQEHKNIYLFKIPDYGSRKEAIIKDISSLSNSKIKNINIENISFSDLGLVDEVIINKNEIVILSNNSTAKKIKELKKELSSVQDDYEKEFILERLAKLENGIANIYVGGKTKTEIKERLLHFEDCLCALEVANEGIVLGEGIAFLSIINKLKDNNTGFRIMKRVLEIPFDKIMKNAGYDEKIIKEEIIKSNYQKVYNFNTNQYDDINNTKIIDPVKVLISALKNSISISSLLLTTQCLVINDNIRIEKPIL